MFVMNTRAILVLSSLLLAACGYRTAFTPTNTPPHPMSARPEASVEMFTATPPSRPFVEVGLLTSAHAGYFSTSSDEEVMMGLRKKGAEMGCDGVFVTQETSRVVGSVSKAGDINTYNLKTFRAACIVFTDTSTVSVATKVSP